MLVTSNNDNDNNNIYLFVYFKFYGGVSGFDQVF